MQVIIDRFEGNFAVVELEKGKFINLPRLLVPGAREGDVVDISVNASETAKRRKNIEKLMDNLFED
jgi:hypothetical protein